MARHPPTRRVKQETINKSLELLQESSNSHEISSLPSGSADSAVPANPNEPSGIVKQEEDSKAKLRSERWKLCKSLLWTKWSETPAVPSVKSRRAWAKAYDIPPKTIHSWYGRLKKDRKAEGMDFYLQDGYELEVEDYQLPQSPRETPMAESSVVASSPPRTPLQLESTFDVVDIVENSPLVDPFLLNAPSTAVDLDFKKLSKNGPATDTRNVVGKEEPQVDLPSVQEPPVGAATPAKGAKRGRKRKVAPTKTETTGEEPPKSKPKVKSVRKKKQTKIKVEPAPLEVPTVVPHFEDNKRTSSQDADSARLDPTPSTDLAEAAPVLANSIASNPSAVEDPPKGYDSLLRAPTESSESAKSLPWSMEPEKYITRPLPPLPSFEILACPFAFYNDCKEAFRTSLEINFDLGIWDPVVEALPPNVLMDVGKDFDDFKWPDIDSP